MNINIRRATLEDVNELVKLSIELGEYNAHHSNDRKKFFQDDWETYYKEETVAFLNKPDSAVFVAEIDNLVVGCISVFYSSQTGYSHIDEFIVTQNQRGSGIGKKLMSEAEKYLKQFDAPIKIEVYDWNKDTIKFYMKNGFEHEGIVLEKTL